MYRYLNHLDSEKAGATAATGFIEALRFLDGVAIFTIGSLDLLIRCFFKRSPSNRKTLSCAASWPSWSVSCCGNKTQFRSASLGNYYMMLPLGFSME